MVQERRLVWRVLRHWEITHGGRLPGRNEINPYLLGEEGANCLLIAVRSPMEHSHLVNVGLHLAVLFCPTDTLAEMLLSHLSRASARCGLIFGGGAR
jgi:hypothetical protein